MTPEQRTAIEILNSIRDFMKENLSEDDYMYLMGMVLDSRTNTVYVPYTPLSPYPDNYPFWPQVTYGVNSRQTGRD